MDSGSPLLVERADGYVRLTLRRPKQRNALDAALQDALQKALEAAARDPAVRAVLLRADGQAFCAGLDLTEGFEFDGRSAEEMTAPIEHSLHPLIRTLAEIPLPVVCAVNGAAAGAGMGLLLACDYVLASENATFLCAFSRLGLATDSGVSFHLPRWIGGKRALAVAMWDEPISARQAEAWGLVWKVAPRDALDAEAEAMAATLARKATKSLALIKRAMHSAFAGTLEEHLAFERSLQIEAAKTGDMREGLAAFRERRAPVFMGR
jgi:2-(1,2-epoxy-1,2-dihydrophenyl)acetyl-CoA isomerase